MAVTLKTLNGNRRLFRAYVELVEFIECCNRQCPKKADAGSLYAQKGAGKRTISKGIPSGNERIARLVRAIQRTV